MKSTFAAIVIAAVAGLTDAVALTNSDFSGIEAGKAFDITWSDAEGPVTLKLKDGASDDLQDVMTLTSGDSSGSYSWTPSASLPDVEYAIEITDSTGVPNYSKQFSVEGATGSTTSASSSATVASSTTLTTITSSTSVSSTSSFSVTSTTTTASSSASTGASTTKTGTASTTTATSSPIPTTNGAQGVIAPFIAPLLLAAAIAAF
ncbi:Ser-Thr-rich glycosyl-phosphatidyl-inositol-anchored membrane family-domain-containing protein [Xylariomycetidae sp. FL2044]|nr:Ser-Thr-rich glycosyl-phosphatidyl-inositol-anchored membrane family-domain-containing protein [Xylariomycetidae sp. FL2044]